MLLGDTEALLAEQLTSPDAQRRATQAAATRVMAGTTAGVPPGTPVELLAPVKAGGMRRRYRGPLVDAWKRFARDLRDGTELDVAAAAARDAGLAALDDAVDANRVPPAARLDGPAFDHPLEWAHPEWRLAAAELDRCVRHCHDQVTAAATAGWVVADVRWPRGEPHRLTLLAAFPAVFDPHGRRALMCVPAVVIEAFTSTAPPNRGKELAMLDAQRVDQRVLELAAPLVFDTEPSRRVQVFAAAQLLVA